jgi:DNA-binding CsgD family transcriptional regulator
MKSDAFLKTAAVWKDISFIKEVSFVDFENILLDKRTDFFHVGDFYYYLFNLKTMSFDYVSEHIEKVLGYDKREVTVPLMISLIHPEDLPYFIEFEKEVVRFFNQLQTPQLSKYKVRYDYRVKAKDGQYKRILHQMVTLLPDNESKVLQTLCYHTDITYLKNNGIPLLSFIGMDGEPSFVDVVANIEVQKPFTDKLSNREREVVKYLAEGLTSTQIASELFISPHTVKKHRRNILKKMELNNTIDLTSKAIREGWL